MDKRRIFSAIDIPDDARASVGRYITWLRDAFPRAARWEREEKLHITINFAGYLDAAELGAFTLAAERGSKLLPEFRIEVSGTGAFIRRRRSGVLWLGLSSDTAENGVSFMSRLADTTSLPGTGPNDRRPFKPHLTIARIRDPQAARSLIDKHHANEFGPVEFQARELVVYESTLLPTGSRYEPLSRHIFTG